MIIPPVVDSHVHFWDPRVLDYPWLASVPGLRRPFLPADYAVAVDGLPVDGVVFVEANPRPDLGLAEVRFAQAAPGVRGIVAYVDLADRTHLHRRLDELQAVSLVKGIRQNIQGHERGFCLRPGFVEGVREAGRRGLSFDLCATHDQLDEVAELCRRCPGTRLVLDHCGKPAIRARLRVPWATSIAELGQMEHVRCKISGLLTEADPASWTEEDLLPYARHVVESFGSGRLLYGSDWPVLTLAGDYARWYQFTRRLTDHWTEEESRAFYGENAVGFYGL